MRTWRMLGGMWVGVAMGGALGAVARHALTLWAARAFPAFPVGTLGINVLGSFLLGLTVALVLRGAVPEAWRVAFGTGFLGAFTTFSTFSVDAVRLLQGGEWRALALYMGGNVGLGLLAALIGLTLGAGRTA